MLIRQYALGDLIQLVYVARKFKSFYNINHVTIACGASHVKHLMACYPDLRFIQFCHGEDVDADVIMVLDGGLEKDHSLSNSENSIHRVNIFNKILGMPDVFKTVAEDWAYRSNGIKFEGDPGVKFVGLQIRGSNPIKTLPYDYVVSLANKLSEKYRVVLLDHSKDKGFEGNNIVNTCGQINVQQCVTLLSKLSAVITMDSGMLWMAHSANVPTVLLLGSTREEERLSLHPLYPEKAKSISLSNMVNCKPCFETQVACKGKHFCMNNFNREDLTNRIFENLKSIVGE
jgi:hypothetical protein